MRRFMIAGLSLAAVAVVLTATIGLATEQWPLARAGDTALAEHPAQASGTFGERRLRAAARRVPMIIVQVDEATALCAGTALVAAILSVAALDPRRRSPTLR